MKVINVHNDLKQFYDHNYGDFQLNNAFFCVNDKKDALTWANYLAEENFESYEEYYGWVVGNSQYSLAFGDMAVVRIYFRGMEEIQFASMAFLPNPANKMPYFRLDLDYAGAKDYVHSSYHVHFGYANNQMRFSLMNYPYPSQYLSFLAFLLGYRDCENFDNGKFFTSLDEFSDKYNHYLNFVTR